MELLFKEKDFDTIANVIVESIENGKSAEDCAILLNDMGYSPIVVETVLNEFEFIVKAFPDDDKFKQNIIGIKGLMIMRINIKLGIFDN